MSTILRKGAKGELVKSVQSALGLVTDGNFGPATELAVMSFQAAHGLSDDGVVGEMTFRAMGIDPATGLAWQCLAPWAIKSAPLTLTDQDIIDAAAMLDKPGMKCEVNALKAFTQVEAAGKGFNEDGTCKIVFERHKFFEYIRDKKLRDQLVATEWDICKKEMRVNSKTAKPYHTAMDRYKSGKAEWDLYHRAAKYDEWAAKMSVSYGVGQVMGFNFKIAGFKTVEEMYTAMTTGGARAQLMAMISFIKNNPAVHNAILKKDWTAAALGYNGAAGNKLYQYDKQLANAYAKLTK